MFLKNKKGISMLEAVLAVGIIAVLASTVASLIVIANGSTEKSLNYQEALWYANEGMEALKSIAFDDLSVMSTGTLSFVATSTSDGYWQLSSSSLPQSKGVFSRAIKVETVYRDENCGVSGSGEIDPDTLKLTGYVFWNDTADRNQDITLTSYRTNWQGPVGECFSPGEALFLTFDLSMAGWDGTKQLRDVFVTNHSSRDAVMTKAIINWNYPSVLQQMFFDNSKVWSSSGPGTPSGDQPSGTLLDHADFIIGAGQTVKMHKMQFSSPMAGATLSIELIMQDDSSVTSEEFTP